MKILKKKYKLFLILILAIFFDQLVKYLIRSSSGFYICNQGISFGFYIPRIIFYPMVLAIIVFLGAYFLDKITLSKYYISKIGLAFILGGALGNLIDRFNFGCIIDFIDLKFFPVFNLADIFIFVGAIIVLFKSHKK